MEPVSGSFLLRVSACVFPGARCEMLVFMVPWCDILKGKTDCAIRSEEILSAGGRLGTTLLSHVLD